MRRCSASRSEAIRAAFVAAAIALLLGGCESGPEDLCEDLGWEPGSPQYEDCMRRAYGRGDDGYSPQSGPKRKNQRGF